MKKPTTEEINMEMMKQMGAKMPKAEKTKAKKKKVSIKKY